jgi:hypothetical protein
MGMAISWATSPTKSSYISQQICACRYNILIKIPSRGRKQLMPTEEELTEDDPHLPLLKIVIIGTGGIR